MKSSNRNIENRLLEILGEITNLNVEENFRHTLLEDIELAALYFKEKNIQSVLNCLAVLTGKMQTYLLLSRCHHEELEKLLIRLHRVQQRLIRLPICIIGPAGPTGATGPTGPAGIPGPMGATGPAGSDKTTTVMTSSFPVSCYPYPKKTSTKPRYFDYKTHVIIFCNSSKKRQRN